MADGTVASSKTAAPSCSPTASSPGCPTALLYPILGDWVVTASMVAGAVFMVVGMRWFRPTCGTPCCSAVFLLNPFLWNGITQFQLATIWAFALFFLRRVAARDVPPHRARSLGSFRSPSPSTR